MNTASIAEQIIATLRPSLHRWRRPLVISLFGLPCAGKTEVAHYLATRYPLIVLSTDALRLQYHLPSGSATLEIMQHVAGILLPQHVGVIFDGIHLGRGNRDQIRALAEQHDAVCGLVYVTASPAIISHRLAERIHQAAETVAARKFVITADHFATIAQYLEEPTDDENVLVVDTSNGIADEQFQPLHDIVLPLLV